MSESNQTINESREQTGELHDDEQEKLDLTRELLEEMKTLDSLEVEGEKSVKAAGKNVFLHVSGECELDAKVGMGLVDKCNEVRLVEFEKVAEGLVDLWATNYTLGELREILGFYKSPLGRKHIKVLDEMRKVTNEAITKFKVAVEGPAKAGLKSLGHQHSLSDVLDDLFKSVTSSEDKEPSRGD